MEPRDIMEHIDPRLVKESSSQRIDDKIMEITHDINQKNKDK